MDNIKTLNGVYRGIVKSTSDPLKQNRIQVTLKTAPGETTSWVWPLMPAGITTPSPSIGQGVWVMFESADPEYPVYFGEFGKHQAANKKLLVKPLDNKQALTGISSYIVVVKQPDGTFEVDLMASLLAMANKLKDHETRIASLESQLTTLHTNLATRTAPSHTHGRNG